MKFFPSFLVHVVLVFFSIVYGDANYEKTVSYSTTVSVDLPCFADLPNTVKVVYIDPETLIKYDNKGEHVMGVADDKCDNGKVRK